MIINFNKKLFNKKYIELISMAYDYALDYLKVPFKSLEVDINFVGKKEIHRQNREFREVDNPTDVLSFPNLLKVGVTDSQVIANTLTKENYISDYNPENGTIFLGCITICKDVVFRQAKEFGNSRAREMTYMAVHGLLHLLGFDHMKEEDKKEMRKVEEEIMDRLDLRRD